MMTKALSADVRSVSCYVWSSSLCMLTTSSRGAVNGFAEFTEASHAGPPMSIRCEVSGVLKCQPLEHDFDVTVIVISFIVGYANGQPAALPTSVACPLPTPDGQPAPHKSSVGVRVQTATGTSTGRDEWRGRGWWWGNGGRAITWEWYCGNAIPQ